MAAFLIANRQHLAERRLDSDKVTADERRRFKVVRAILARVNVTASGIVSKIDESPFGLADKAYSIVLDDSARPFRELPLFELPHEELVLYCTSLPYALGRIRLRLDADHIHLATIGPRLRSNQQKLRNELSDLLKMTLDACRFCDAEIEQRSNRPS